MVGSRLIGVILLSGVCRTKRMFLGTCGIPSAGLVRTSALVREKGGGGGGERGGGGEGGGREERKGRGEEEEGRGWEGGG